MSIEDRLHVQILSDPDFDWIVADVSYDGKYMFMIALRDETSLECDIHLPDTSKVVDPFIGKIPVDEYVAIIAAATRKYVTGSPKGGIPSSGPAVDADEAGDCGFCEMGKRRKYREELELPPVDEALFGGGLKIENYYINVSYGYELICFVDDNGKDYNLLTSSDLLAKRMLARLRELGVRTVDREAERKNERRE